MNQIALRILLLYLLLFVVAEVGLSQDKGKTISGTASKAASLEPTRKNLEKWKNVRLKLISLCVPEEFQLMKVECIDSDCYRFESDDFVLGIDDDNSAQYPSVQKKFPSYKENHFETEWGTAWTWSYENNGDIKFISGARFTFNDNRNMIVTLALVSKSKAVEQLGEAVFRSVNIVK